MNYMGVDIGTSGCKAVVFDENGKQLSLAYLDYSPVFFPDGGAELNSAEVLDKTVEVIKTAALQAGRGTVAGIGVSSQGEAFTPSGTPFFDTDTKGAIIGLRLSTTRDEFAKALLEGVAFEMKLNLDILEKSGCKTESLRAVGGGAKSRVWTQLKADVTGRPISVLDVTEAGCLGVAILACGADTGSDIRKLAKSWIRERGVCEPRSDIARIYNERFQQYLRLYPAIRQVEKFAKKS